MSSTLVSKLHLTDRGGGKDFTGSPSDPVTLNKAAMLPSSPVSAGKKRKRSDVQLSTGSKVEKTELSITAVGVFFSRSGWALWLFNALVTGDTSRPERHPGLGRWLSFRPFPCLG